jgi:two-component system, OmpR family, sensor histidine kinase ChvG
MNKSGVVLRPARKGGKARSFSPLTLRILAINVLALAILMGGLLYLGQYQERIVQVELDVLRTQARLVAGALGESAAEADSDGTQTIATDTARTLVRRLVEAADARTRLFATDGTMIADSRILMGPRGVVQIEDLDDLRPRNPFAQVGEFFYHSLFNMIPPSKNCPVYREAMPQRAGDYEEVMGALAGYEHKQVRRTHNGRLLLAVAVPVQRYKQVLGAVLLTRSGEAIEEGIRQVRFDILRAFAVAMTITVLLSLYLGRAIVRPIRFLAGAAERIRRGQGRLREIPDFSRRNDEIGDLSGALADMTQALWTRMDAIENFAADVAHEIKNPLTSLRSAVETAERVTDPDRQKKLMAIILDDVKRLDRLISDISDASRLDAELSRCETAPLDLVPMLQGIVSLYERKADCDNPSAPQVTFLTPVQTKDWRILGLEGRLAQVFRNLIDNALSFSPPGGVVRVSLDRRGALIDVRVEDDGPGIPENKLDAIFDRFYTERPKAEKFGQHSGLGLSISRQIVEIHQGKIAAANRVGSEGAVEGAIFTVTLPAVK